MVNLKLPDKLEEFKFGGLSWPGLKPYNPGFLRLIISCLFPPCITSHLIEGSSNRSKPGFAREGFHQQVDQTQKRCDSILLG
jgi:hypothetical protein